MKPFGPHPRQSLTPEFIRICSLPGRYSDGGGLYLVVTHRCTKRWVLRTMVRGRRHDIGLGSLRRVDLAKARERAPRYRAMLRAGEPLPVKRRGR